MKTRKKTATAQLSRLAQETAERAVQEPAPARQKLEALQRNVGRIVMLPLKELTLSENVRKYVPTDTAEFAQLLDSVKRDGILQNLVADLRLAADGGYSLTIVSGQRRFLAGERAGLESCPVRIMQYSDRAAKLAHGITENVLRDELHCLDLAEGYAALLQEGWSEEQIAETFDRKRQTVFQLLRLARFPAAAKAAIRAEMDKFTTRDLLNKFVAHRWQDEGALVASLQEHAQGRREKRAEEKTDRQLRQQTRALSQKSGYKLSVSGTKALGQLTIKWENEAQRQRLFRLLEESGAKKR
jgi:ParB family chromosome partitioning protein